MYRDATQPFITAPLQSRIQINSDPNAPPVHLPKKIPMHSTPNPVSYCVVSYHIIHLVKELLLYTSNHIPSLIISLPSPIGILHRAHCFRTLELAHGVNALYPPCGAPPIPWPLAPVPVLLARK